MSHKYLSNREYLRMKKTDILIEQNRKLHMKLIGNKGRNRNLTVMEVYEQKQKRKREQEQEQRQGQKQESRYDVAKMIMLSKKSGEIICQKQMAKFDDHPWYKFSNTCIISHEKWEQLKTELDIFTIEGEETSVIDIDRNIRISDIIKF